METKRLFIGIPIEWTPQINKVSQSFMKAFVLNRISWTLPENAHITLHFFGDTKVDKIDAINDMLQETIAKTPSFSIWSKEANVFGKYYAPSTLWYGFKRSKELDNLHENICERLLDLRFDVPRKEFRPHVTLARFKETVQGQVVKRLIVKNKFSKQVEYPIKTIALYESQLTPKGPNYTILNTFSLAD